MTKKTIKKQGDFLQIAITNEIIIGNYTYDEEVELMVSIKEKNIYVTTFLDGNLGINQVCIPVQLITDLFKKEVIDE